jgi:hypothetical protein
MARKNNKVGEAAEKMADILIAHMEETMTPAQAKAMRTDIHKLAVKSTRQSSLRGKLSQSARNGDARPLSRASAKKP